MLRSCPCLCLYLLYLKICKSLSSMSYSFSLSLYSLTIYYGWVFRNYPTTSGIQDDIHFLRMICKVNCLSFSHQRQLGLSIWHTITWRFAIGITIILMKLIRYSLEQSCELAHFFLSSALRCECCFRIDRPHPAVIVPSRENARFTIGELGTLFGLKI